LLDETRAEDLSEKAEQTKRLPVEETFRLILERSPWEPMEPLAAHVNQKGPVKIPEWFDAERFSK